MLDPISTQISNHAARQAADAKRPLDRRRRASEKGERDGPVDSFDSSEHGGLGGVEQAASARPLADAVGEESHIERRSQQTEGGELAEADSETQRADGVDRHDRTPKCDQAKTGSLATLQGPGVARLDLTA